MPADGQIVDELEVAARMRLCFATPTYLEAAQPTNSGVATATHTLARGLQQAGHEVHVVALSRAVSGEAVVEGVPVHYVAPDQLHWYASKVPLIGRHMAHPLRELANSLRLGRVVMGLHRRHHFDLIESTETGSFALAFQRAVPLIIRLHGEEYTFVKHSPGKFPLTALRLTRVLQRVALRRAKRLISPSLAHAQTIAQELGRSAETISVVPHGCPLPIVPRIDLPDSPIVLFVGRLEDVKGIRDALIAFAKARLAVPQAQLILIGGNHPTLPQAILDALMEQLGVHQAVRQLGSLAREAVMQWYRRARVMLMPSCYESFGLVALEAMAHGLPIIGYASGALPELIGQAGFLVPKADTDALARALTHVLTDDQVWQMLSAHAIQRAECYSVERQIEQSLAIYRSIGA